MDINLTGQFWGMPFNLSGIADQSINYVIFGAIAGALLTGIMNLLRDLLNRKRDREDTRNKLIGELKGQKILTLQYYAFYFFSLIAREYLACRSVIQAVYAIDYKHVYSYPETERNKEIMRIADEAREETIEHRGCQKEEEELKKWKLELAKSNKHLLTIVGSLQNYYSSNPSFNELSKQIELAMDKYAQLEQTVMDEFSIINQDAQMTAGKIPAEAYEEEKKIDPTLDERWATFGDKGIDILLPRINKLKDNYHYKNIKSSEDNLKKLKEKRQSVSENLDIKINALIDLPQTQQNKSWWQVWRRS